MSFKKNKTGYIFATIIAVTFIFISVNLLVIKRIDSSFIQIQEEAARHNINFVEGIFKREMESLSIITTDWSMWEDMYDFASNPSQEFIDLELQDETFEEINVNIIFIKNAEGDILFSSQVYGKIPDEKNIPETIFDYFEATTINSGASSGDNIRRTILNVGSRKILLASRQITKSDGTGESRGELFFGRYIEEGFIEEFDTIPGFHFNVMPYDSDKNRMVFSDISEENPVSIKLENRRRIVGIKLLEGIFLEKPLILEIEQVPSIYAKYIDIVAIIIIGAGLAYLATVFCVLFIFGKYLDLNRGDVCAYFPQDKLE